jgi:hypothetical protein
MRGLISILVVVAMVFAWLYWQREQEWQALQSRNSLLQQEVAEQRASGVENSQLAKQQMETYERSIGTMFVSAIHGLEWGANQASLYGFDELPLGESRLALIDQLAEQLVAIGFSGVVRIETHVADFCLFATGADGFELATGKVPAATCDRIGWTPGEAYELGLRQSVGFANFVRLAEERFEGKIRYEIVSLGNSEPVMDYPATSENVSAAAWNNIAAKNNRVEISIIPEGF